MIRLKQYKRCDAGKIVSWCEDEETFLMWGGDRFGNFPITAETMNRKYFDENGDCGDEDDFYPMTAVDGGGPVGHFIIRHPGPDALVLRFGWVIVDGQKRGRGIGREMLVLGLRYAFDIMKADKVTIGVYENNLPAYRCYLSAGFREVGFREAGFAEAGESFAAVGGEERRIIELEANRDEFIRRSQISGGLK